MRTHQTGRIETPPLLFFFCPAAGAEGDAEERSDSRATSSLVHTEIIDGHEGVPETDESETEHQTHEKHP